MKNIGLIGCGNIAETYFRAQEYFNNINFVACADINLDAAKKTAEQYNICLLYTSPSPRDDATSRMPSSA